MDVLFRTSTRGVLLRGGTQTCPQQRRFIAYESLYSVVRRQQPGRRNARCHFPPRVPVSARHTLADGAARRVQRPAPLRQAVYDAIVDLIVQGTLQRGQHLVENELAEYLGVSRQPVREALQRLQTDGWIDLAPRRARSCTRRPRTRWTSCSASARCWRRTRPGWPRERHCRGRQPAVGVAAGRHQRAGRQRLGSTGSGEREPACRDHRDSGKLRASQAHWPR